MTPLDRSRRSFVKDSIALVGTTPFLEGMLRAQTNEVAGPLLAYVGTFSSPLHDVMPTQVDLPPGNGRGNRETVARYLRSAVNEAEPANAPLGSDVDDAESNPANAPIGSPGPDDSTAAPAPVESLVGRLSECAPFQTVIIAAWERDLSAQRIYQDLVAEHGFTGSYYSVRRFIRRLGRRSELPVRRLECEPGEECQVDFGRGAPIVMSDGRRRTTHVFRVVLSHSRKAYSEAVTRQTTEAFLRALENAFVHFGGVPRLVVLDNLKAAVKQADWFDPELNPKVQEFARHYGTIFWPTRPYTPRHKGKVERGIGYVKGNALKGRTFVSLEEENRFLQEWEESVADTRIHGTTRRQVGSYFVAVEKPALPPPTTPWAHSALQDF